MPKEPKDCLMTVRDVATQNAVRSMRHETLNTCVSYPVDVFGAVMAF